MQTFGIAIAVLGLAGASAGIIWTASASCARVQIDRLLGVISGVIVTSIGLVLKSIPL